jgi:type II secretory pathway pseudopilin PulG
MRSFLKKLKSKAGESLVESLAAILIFTLASVVMYSMVSTSADLNRKVKEMDEQNQQYLIAVETAQNQYQNGEATMTFTIQGKEVAKVDVVIYGGKDIHGNKDGSLFTYFAGSGS